MKNFSQEQRQRLEKEIFWRNFSVKKEEIDEQARTVPLAFSSEEPYRRWFGIEILGHEKDEVDLSFLNSGRAPLLAGHDHNDQVGVIEKAWLDPDRKGRAIVRFGKSARAEEFFQDVLDGIRGNVSVGYQINELKLIESDEEKGDTFRIIRWTPYESSLVSVPADTTVGVGRDFFDNQERKDEPMQKKQETRGEGAAPAVDPVQIASDTRQAELSRIREIEALGREHKFEDAAGTAIAEGKTIDQFRAYVLDELKKRGLKPVEQPDPEIGLSEKEAQQFSFLKAINALANPTQKKFQDAAGFEFEASQAVAQRMRQDAKGILVPYEVLKRDLTVGTPTAGGNLVGTNLMAGSFIDLLRAKMMVSQMGAMSLSGLIGDVAIPRQTGGAAAYWLAESGAPTESQQTVDQVPLTPKTVGAYTDISRKLLLQSSIDVENFVKMDLARVLALALDLAAIAGTGADNQPTGILNTSGIGAVIGGANGLAPAWSHIVNLWSEVAQDSADVGATGFLTNTKVVGKLMTVEKASDTGKFVCEKFPGPDGLTNLAGARCGVSNQVPSNLTKGSSSGICSAIIYGNFADLIFGLWGALDITVDPYSNSTSGTVRVVELQDADIAIRHAESFAAMQDALTT